MTDQKRFVVVALLLAAFPNIPAPTATMNLYVEMLSDIPEEVLATATRHVISRHKFNCWPTIAEIREACVNMQTGANRFPTAFDAWCQVQKAIRDIGSYKYPTFENPLIEKSINGIGGWKLLCLSENQTADRARFIEAYDIFLKRATEDTYTLPEVADLTKRLSAGNNRLLNPPRSTS
jgi:hypothetical protein